MRNDLRLIRVIERYPKGERHWDVKPRQLDDFAMQFFEGKWALVFDPAKYDYFMHVYARREFTSALKDLSVPCEDGPPTKIPLDANMQWIGVRPDDDGFEAYEALPSD